MKLARRGRVRRARRVRRAGRRGHALRARDRQRRRAIATSQRCATPSTMPIASRATLVDLGGFAPGDVVVLRGGDAEAARAALIALNDRIRTAGAADAMLVVYYSGHADAEALHLGATDFALAAARAARARLAGRVSPARRRRVPLRRADARQGRPRRARRSRSRSATRSPPTASCSGPRAPRASRRRSPTRSGARCSPLPRVGARRPGRRRRRRRGHDRPRPTSTRAPRRCARRVARSPALQHPTFRDELAGRDAIVLTRPGTLGPRRAALRVPAERDALVLAGNADGAVIAEVGLHDATRTLNVRAGTYFIRERGDTQAARGHGRGRAPATITPSATASSPRSTTRASPPRARSPTRRRRATTSCPRARSCARRSSPAATSARARSPATRSTSAGSR